MLPNVDCVQAERTAAAPSTPAIPIWRKVGPLLNSIGFNNNSILPAPLGCALRGTADAVNQLARRCNNTSPPRGAPGSREYVPTSVRWRKCPQPPDRQRPLWENRGGGAARDVFFGLGRAGHAARPIRDDWAAYVPLPAPPARRNRDGARDRSGTDR